MKRRRARKQILKLLYQHDLQGELSNLWDLYQDWLAEWRERHPELAISEDRLAYVEDVLRGIDTHRDELDREITERAAGWRLERLHAVDRNVLRLGIYEMLHRSDIPPEVIVDEAVELAKAYGTERSGAFVNGILDRVWKDRRSQVEASSGPSSQSA